MQTIPERGMVMYTTIKIGNRRGAFTLVEMLVVIAIIIVIAALAATFAPRVNDDQNLTRAVDNLEQWLLTAKMRAKRDGLATGLRFVQAPGDANSIYGPSYSQFQYIQQPEPIAGYSGGPTLVSASNGIVTFSGVDFSLGGIPYPNQWLVQPGDYLEVNGGGVYIIGQVSPHSPGNTLVLGVPNPSNPYVNSPTPSAYDLALSLTLPTTNFRILRQPRILIGEEPLTLPNNYAANFSPIPNSGSTLPGTNVALGPSGYPEILFSPTGAVIGTNAGTPILWISVWDTTMEVPDPNRVGIVGIQGRSGFIGAYSVSLSGNPFLFVQMARESGL